MTTKTNVQDDGPPSAAAIGDVPAWDGTAYVRSSLSDAGAVPTSRTISTGTGLSGGGDLSANRTIAVTAAIPDPPASSTGDVIIDATATPRVNYFLAPASDQTFDPTAATVSQQVTLTKTSTSTHKLTIKVGSGASVAGFTVQANGVVNTNFDLPASATNTVTAYHQWTLTIDVPNKIVYVSPAA